MEYEGERYFYKKNIQGDIIGLVDKTGTEVVTYTYNTWGLLTGTTDRSGKGLAEKNPFRYREYYYDVELGLYYISSRYYDPETRRFLNADDPDVLEIQSDLQDKNLYVYCDNNPVVRVDEDGERVPLTIADYDREKETVTIIYQVVGYTTELLSKKAEGDYVQDFVGPLGQPAPLHKCDRVIGVAGGVGAAPLYPQLRKLAKMGVPVDVIIGGKSAEFVILKELFEEFCDNVYIATDDGSLGTKGFVTTVLEDQIKAGVKYDEVIAIGPLIMMKNVVKITKEYDIPTMVSLNPIMIDGTGMCGGCRVNIGGETKFACVDGPDFDGFKVNFDECMQRQDMFREEEHECRIGRGM